jgi:hypothetical protein
MASREVDDELRMEMREDCDDDGVSTGLDETTIGEDCGLDRSICEVLGDELPYD